MRPQFSFSELAADPDPRLDELALALAAEFREVDSAAAFAHLDALGAELVPPPLPAEPLGQVEALRSLLGARHGFTGAREDYDHPDNSMLDLVLERRSGLPILLSVVYVAVARRVGIALSGVGLPGHFVAGHFGQDPPLLIDPFDGGAPVAGERADGWVRAWGPHETALRMLNNLVGSYERRSDLSRAIRAAELRLELPLGERQAAGLGAELRGLRARLN